MCRVLPDVTAVDKAFDYLIPDELGRRVRAGSVVRVMLAGRKVRGWVLDADIATDVDPAKLRPVLAVISAGPPREVVALCEWIAWQYCGPFAAVLRSATAPNNVPADIFETAASDSQASDSGGRDGGSPIGVGTLVADSLGEPASEVDRAADALAAAARQAALRPPGTGALDSVAVVRWPPRHDRRRLVAQLLAPTGSTIVLTADGARAAAFARWLRTITANVALLHSDEHPSSRTAAWRLAAAGNCVVVGGRMAVLAPVPDLRAVIVIDDADEALQEERTPTWHAREALLERAAQLGAASYVVSPAPTVTAIAKSQQIPAVLAPPAAIEREGWPRIEVIDVRDEPPMTRLVSAPLVAAIRACVDAGAPSLLILNRRGGVRLLRCAACNSLTRWDALGRPLWDHDTPDDIEVKPTFCVNCGGTKLRVLSGGVQRLAPELRALLNGPDVEVVDAAVTEAPDVPVLLGTEALLHRREVRRRRPGLVAFLDFDAELYATRYRANEQALWLAVRASHAMSGRTRGECRVIVQTHEPDHLVVRALQLGDPTLMSSDELERRRTFGLPPFSALAEVRGDAGALDHVNAAIVRMSSAADALGAGDGVHVDRDDQRMLVQARTRDALAQLLETAIAEGRTIGKLRVVVDPPRI